MLPVNNANRLRSGMVTPIGYLIHNVTSKSWIFYFHENVFYMESVKTENS